jgi:hypothetical protein
MVLARWLSRDPLGEDGGINLYDYVLGNPVTWTDSLGLDLRLETTSKVGGFHEHISVDTPTGPYNQSFGMIDGNMPMQGYTLARNAVPDYGSNGSGMVYIDQDRVSYVVMTFPTTPDEDALILQMLKPDLYKTAPYNPLSNSCRTYSEHRFNEIVKAIMERRMSTWWSDVKAWFNRNF